MTGSPHNHSADTGHVHSHDHGHSHVPAVTKDNEHNILVSFLVILSFMVVEAVGGILSGSLALLADAGHMLTDAIALGLAYLAFRLGRRKPDAKRTFGYARFEVVAGLVNAVTLFGIVGWIIYEAIGRFGAPQPVMAAPMLIVAIIGMIVNLFVLWYLTRGDTEHVNIKGAVLHVMGDLLGSVGAILAAIVIWLTGWTPIDPILSVFVAMLILRSAWGLLKNTLHILFEGAPANVNSDMVIQHIQDNVPDVASVHHVHVWSLTSGRVLATLQVQPTAQADIRALIKQVEHELETKFNIEHSTIGLDLEGDASCSLENPPQLNAAHIGHNH
ncbi:cobalt-zinc-cadmium efflux system protein [Cohaesibacter sp. ES.047]|uniref:cation diffusion facilitator family transporter n=1 Tax=Cohaesibacter sp. ES.047 TaxID=1798205 RepID=UPI000BB7EEB2|nr:cation diffusion facilitator family transporter [Cohaesibacter sp. ES.047]SNY93597.1 cobalt-zinc-cadmium efflux system protein [Cohaesibacter sp. ES.047]